jgi:hypothetical protein
MNILLKNILDACVGALGFYLFGYAFAYGLKPGASAWCGSTQGPEAHAHAAAYVCIVTVRYQILMFACLATAWRRDAPTPPCHLARSPHHQAPSPRAS